MSKLKEIYEIRRQNLRRLIKEHKTQEALAGALDVSPGYISQLSNGTRDIKEETAIEFEHLLSLPEKWFDRVHSQINDNASTYTLKTPTNISEGPKSKGLLPLISWVQAGDFCEAIDLFEVGGAENWYPCPVNHSEQTYILRVQGSSMEPEYRDGDLIFVDPHVQPNHNSDVILRLVDSNTATFKRLQIVGGEHYVSPINKEWPEPVIRITELAQICGVVIFSGRLR